MAQRPTVTQMSRKFWKSRIYKSFVYPVSSIWCKCMSTNKFFKDNKIAQAFRAVAICSLWKIYKCLWHQIAREIMLLLVNSQYMKKHHRKSRHKILKNLRTLFVNCACVTILHFCFNFALMCNIRMH